MPYLRNTITGATVKVHAVYDHPSCSHGKAVWVDEDNAAYLQVGLEHLCPLYQLFDDVPSVDIVKAINDRIRELGLTNKEAASRASISEAQLSNIRNRKAGIKLSTLERLLSVLGLSVS